MTKTKSVDATPSDDKTLQAVQATPSDGMTLEELMQIHPWKGDQPADTHQAFLRGLIKRVAQLEEAGISCGVLDASQIIYQGSKVTIRNEPTEPSQGRFREQIKIWVSKIFQVPAAPHSNIEYKDFLKEISNAGDNLKEIHNAGDNLKEIHNAGDNLKEIHNVGDNLKGGNLKEIHNAGDNLKEIHKARDNFKQLESHPFLVSYERKAYFLLEKINTLYSMDSKHTNWKWQYKKDVTKVVKIHNIIANERGYSDVLGQGNYEENALGALLYSRNVIAHIKDKEYFGQDEGPSIEEVGKRLSEFFPEMMLDFYKFVVKKGIDTRSEPRSVNLVD